MPHFQSWEEIENFEDERFGIKGLTPAESKLKEAAAVGAPCVLGPEYGPQHIPQHLPDEPKEWTNPTPGRHIRADVLRFILTSSISLGLKTETGILLFGALISDELTLFESQIPNSVSIQASWFECEIMAHRAKFFSTLNISHCRLPAINALGCQILGQLVCYGVKLSATEGIALNFLNATISGNAIFDRIETHSSIRLSSAKIGGQLSLEEGRLRAADDIALSLQGAQVAEAFYFRNIQEIQGWIDLNTAYVHNLVDDMPSIEKVEHLILDGFTYDRIVGTDCPTDFETRLQWLSKGDHFEDQFFPQPYIQLARVLTEMGHERDAREIRVTLAEKLRCQRRKDRQVSPNGDISVGLLSTWRDLSNPAFWLWHKLSLLLTGHGYKPIRAMWALVFLIFSCWLLAHQAWEAGDFAPNSDVILSNMDWRELEGASHQANAWGETVSGKDWESFNPIAYAADIVIPIVEFGQTKAWAPSTSRGPWGANLWWARWFFTAAGWVVTALGAAAITGVIRRE